MSIDPRGKPRSGRAVASKDPFRMPAEWAPHEATWLSWPHNRDTWPGKFEVVEPAYQRIVEILAESEPIYINVLDESHEFHVRELLGDRASRAHFFRIPTNDAWCRDHGPTVVVSAGPNGRTRRAVSWHYNAWGGKYPPFDLDERAASSMAGAIGLGAVQANLVGEGGAIETNGRGLLLTTRSCLLNPNRNPGRTSVEVEEELQSHLGMDRILWLPGGDLEGDDTDGHIDNLARFVNYETAVMPLADDRLDANYDTLRDNYDFLLAHSESVGHSLRIVPLPVPEPVFYEGRRLPASYANFYIANASVIVPTFRCPADQTAVEMLQELIPHRRVVGVDCTDIVWGLGAVHCLTQQLPA